MKLRAVQLKTGASLVETSALVPTLFKLVIEQRCLEAQQMELRNHNSRRMIKKTSQLKLLQSEEQLTVDQ